MCFGHRGMGVGRRVCNDTIKFTWLRGGGTKSTLPRVGWKPEIVSCTLLQLGALQNFRPSSREYVHNLTVPGLACTIIILLSVLTISFTYWNVKWKVFK